MYEFDLSCYKSSIDCLFDYSNYCITNLIIISIDKAANATNTFKVQSKDRTFRRILIAFKRRNRDRLGEKHRHKMEYAINRSNDRTIDLSTTFFPAYYPSSRNSIVYTRLILLHFYFTHSRLMPMYIVRNMLIWITLACF